MKHLKRLTASIFIVAVYLLQPVTLSAQNTILQELDKTLDEADRYVQIRLSHIASLEKMLHTSNITLKQQYNIYKSLYNEYYAFQFDRAMDMLDKRANISKQMGNKALMIDDQIDRAMLYTLSGMYFEAGDMLDNHIDTLKLSQEQMVRYYEIQQRFHSDFYHYTSDSEARTRSGIKKGYYRQRILDITSTDDPIHQHIIMRNFMDSGQWNEAETINISLLSKYQPDQHEFAKYAYDRARILEALERRDEMREWFARSAMADIRTATKDNASLCSLAQSLLEIKDIDHAFRYITISLNDAIFYNAKLRPWQISYIMPQIEQAYHAQQQINNEHLLSERRYANNLLIIISILAALLHGICVYMAALLNRSRRNSRKIKEMNERISCTNDKLQSLNKQLAEVNGQLSEANTVKEEYIALFLSMCSDYIEKLKTMQRDVRRKLSQGKVTELEKEVSSSSLMDKELNNFYEMFDNAFLNLYPNFVEEFNALLKPEAHIEPKRSEKLNTELRIFALIRLGINDSSRIAALLRYSVNTIYNYRARIKNNALSNRESFEERIKTIHR